MGIFSLTVNKVWLSRAKKVEQGAIRNRREGAIARAALENEVRKKKRLLERTVKTWDHPVKFERRTSARIGLKTPTYLVYTDDPVWNMLNKGTSWRAVRLDPGYKLKTRPGEYESYPGGPDNKVYFGNGYRYRGIIARNWTNKIIQAGAAADLKKEFERQLAKYIQEIRNTR